MAWIWGRLDEKEVARIAGATAAKTSALNQKHFDAVSAESPTQWIGA